MNLRWIIGTIITLLGLVISIAIIPLIRNYYKIFSRLTGLESKLSEITRIDFDKINDRLIRIEKDAEFATKAIWQFLISKVHSDEDEFEIDELLDKWKQHKLIKAEEIKRLTIGLNKVMEVEIDNSKKAAAELLLKMLDKGVGIITRM